MKSRMRSVSDGLAGLFEQKAETEDQVINLSAISKNIRLEGNEVGIQVKEGPCAPEPNVLRDKNIQFQPAHENEESSRMTEEVNESFEGIEEIAELEEDIASGNQSSKLRVRQESYDNVWESPQVVNAKKQKAQKEAIKEFFDTNLSQDEDLPEVAVSRSKKQKLRNQESSAQPDSSEADDEKSASDPTNASGENK